MNSVAPAWRLSSRSDSTSCAGSSKWWWALRKLWIAGLGWSVGRSSAAGAPASRSFQYWMGMGDGGQAWRRGRAGMENRLAIGDWRLEIGGWARSFGFWDSRPSLVLGSWNDAVLGSWFLVLRPARPVRGVHGFVLRSLFFV